MPISVELTAEDVRKSTRLFYSKQTNVWVFLGLSGLLFLYSIWKLVESGLGSLQQSIFGLMMFPLLFFMFFINLPNRLVDAKSKADGLPEIYDLDFDEKEISLITPNAVTRYPWADFKKMVESKRHIIIEFSTKKNCFVMLPKRAFSSSDQETEFMEFVSRNL